MKYYAFTKKTLFSKKRFLSNDGLFHTKRKIKKLGLKRRTLTESQAEVLASQIVNGKTKIKEPVHFVAMGGNLT